MTWIRRASQCQLRLSQLDHNLSNADPMLQRRQCPHNLRNQHSVLHFSTFEQLLQTLANLVVDGQLTNSGQPSPVNCWIVCVCLLGVGQTRHSLSLPRAGFRRALLELAAQYAFWPAERARNGPLPTGSGFKPGLRCYPGLQELKSPASARAGGRSPARVWWGAPIGHCGVLAACCSPFLKRLALAGRFGCL